MKNYNYKKNPFCIMCGDENPHSFGLNFKNEEDGAVFAVYNARKELQGYRGVMHGGMISAILDSAMFHCLYFQNVEAMTGELKVRYRKSVPCEKDFLVKAKVVNSRSPLYKLEAQIICEDEILVSAAAKFMQIERDIDA